MSSKGSRRAKVKPKMLIQETLYRTKRFFHKTFINVKSFILWGCQTSPKSPTVNPVFSCDSKINSRLQELDKFCRSLSERWDSIEASRKKEGHLTPNTQAKEDEGYNKRSMNVAKCSALNGVKEDEYYGRQEKLSYLAAGALARKMKELEMDCKDMNPALDIEEVIHYYSRLTCPAYIEIVDKFFMEMYAELGLSQLSRSVNSSMRKLGSASIHSSMRSLGPLKL